MNDTTQEPVFDIALVMAGAVSAGAYTAGVLDFLVEALTAFEAEKAARPGTYPWRVRIRVISGASAGAIVGAIFASTLRPGIRPVRSQQPAAGASNPLFDAWVERVDISGLLGEADLARAPLSSLLDSTALDRIAAEALAVNWAPGGPQLPAFVGGPLELYFTINNLRGVPYGIDFRGDGAQAVYGMTLHADSIRFRLDPGSEASEDGETVVLGRQNGTGGGWGQLGQAALASGAFPIGLAPRALKRTQAEIYNQRLWTLPEFHAAQPGVNARCTVQAPIPTALPAAVCTAAYDYVNVDGGTIDNEPFELGRRTLALDRDREHNPRSPHAADCAVLMIDPFPCPPVFTADYKVPEGLRLLPAAKHLLSASIQQMRFKLPELMLADHPDVYSRFLITPVRYGADGLRVQLPGTPIACGTLGGFGGFLNRAFRAHDYLLGRLNCQQFLRRHFVLAGDNPLFGGTAGPGSDYDQRFGRKPTDPADTYDGAPVQLVPILPLFGSAADAPIDGFQPRAPFGLPWPQIRESGLQPVQDGLKSRADAVVGALLKENVESSIGRFALNSAWRVFGRSRVLDKTMGMVRDALAVAGLLAGVAPPAVPTGGPDTPIRPVRTPDAGAPGGRVGNG